MKKISYRIRAYDVTHKTQDVKNLDRKIAHFKKNKIVIIKKGLMKNFQGKVIRIKPIYSKNDFVALVRFKDLSKFTKGTVGTNKFWYKGKELRTTAKHYKTVLPRWSSDIK